MAFPFPIGTKVLLCLMGGAIAPPLLLCLSPSAVAQLTPDGSLGAENSILNPAGSVNGLPTTLIEGGAARGSNLFHSFQDFNIDTAQRVYFASPSSIENILTRVTGGSLSRIDGLLGVDGAANLFLLNPNGVLFGPNARLDISGSFLTSTGNRFTFADGSEFSAVPLAGELLTVSVPLGVQFNPPQGDITSTGVLEAGADLTLLGNNLSLEGQLLTGGNLTLQAADTVTIRDTAADAFVANSGGDLTIQGHQGIDILTLQHLDQTPFVSGGDLRLISDGIISGDAHFASNGGLQFLTLAGNPGEFVSLYDPIISANGNVVFGNYTGAALKVEATGSIQGGDIRITGRDTTLTPDGSGSDADLLASGRALILRAGVASVANPNVSPDVTQAQGGTTFTATAPPASGNIVVGVLTTIGGMVSPPATPTSDGGPIILAATGDITTRDLQSFTQFDGGSGGDISITSITGQVTVNGGINASVAAANARDGGDVSIRARGAIRLTDVFTNSFASGQPTGNGGDISLISEQGGITAGSLFTYTRSDLGGRTGSGGDIIVTTGAGDIQLAILSSHALSQSASLAFASNSIGNAGSITVETLSGSISSQSVNASSFAYSGSAGGGGAITFQATDDITVNGGIAATSYAGATGNTGAGGTIDISSSNGSIRLRDVQSFSNANNSDAGSGGDISITSQALGQNTDAVTILIDGTLDTSSFSAKANAANGGEIFLAAQSGNITISRDVLTFSIAENVPGNGGAVSINAVAGSILGAAAGQTKLTTTSLTPINTRTISQDGGDVTLIAQDDIARLDVLTQSSTGNAGSVTIQQSSAIPTELRLLDSSLTTSDQIEIAPIQRTIAFGDAQAQNNIESVSITQNISRQNVPSGSSGNVEIASLGDLTLDNFTILSNANGTQPAGNIQVTSGGDITLTNSTIDSDTNSLGTAGDVTVQSLGTVTLINSTIDSDTSSSGAAGSIAVAAQQGVRLQGGSSISTKTSATGAAGNIAVAAPTLTLVDAGTQISAETRSSGNAGTITLSPADGGATLDIFLLGDDTLITSSTLPSPGSDGSAVTGDGGSIVISAPAAIALRGTGDLKVETETAGNAGGLLIAAPSITIDGVEVSASTEFPDNLTEAQQSALIANRSSGNGGDISVVTARLNFNDDGEITAATSSTGTGGDIFLTSPSDELIIQGAGSINVNTENIGPAGQLEITAPTLTVDGTQLSASTTGAGAGGDVILNADTIRFGNDGEIAATTTGAGTGGSIIFNPAGDTLTVAGAGTISVDTSGVGRAGTLRSGNATNPAIAIPNINLDRATLSASTSGPQAGGDILLRTEQITFRNQGTISASTSGAGAGGSLTVSSNGPLTLQGNGSLTVAATSEDSGRAGTLTVNGSSLRLREGVQLSANSTASAGGGDIAINLDGSLLMSGNSYINATSTNPNAGDGGNITLRLGNGYLIGAPGQDNDIIANAVGGSGGNINITALRIFGFAEQDDSSVERLRGNGTNDISASSEFGFDGAITLNTLDLDPSQGLVELPTDLSDRANQIAPGCGLGNADGQSAFVITGRGGLPPSPSNPIEAGGGSVPWVVGEAESTATSPPPYRSPEGATPLIEAQGIAIDGEGNAHLVASGRSAATVADSMAGVCNPALPQKQI